MAQECIGRYSREFLRVHIHNRESQNKRKFLLAWCIIYSSLNFLSNKANNKANTREAGDGKQTLRFEFHILQIN